MRLTAGIITLALVFAGAVAGQWPAPVYPGAVAGQSTLLVAKMGQSTLSIGVNGATLSVPVVSSAQFLANSVVQVDSELMKVCTAAAGVLTVCAGGRGYGGTTATIHAAGAQVLATVSTPYHNNLAAEVGAIETALGVGMTNVNSALTTSGVSLPTQCTDTGAVNAITCPMPGVTTYPAYWEARVMPLHTNTGAATINVNGLGPIPVQRATVALTGGEYTAGVPTTFVCLAEACQIAASGGSAIAFNNVSLQGLGSPAVTITHGGTPATTRYTYVVVATDAAGKTRAVARETDTGAAALNGTNYNRVTVAAWSVTAPFIAPVGVCNVYRTFPLTTDKLIGTISNCASGGYLDDIGQTPTSGVPATDTSGVLYATGGVNGWNYNGSIITLPFSGNGVREYTPVILGYRPGMVVFDNFSIRNDNDDTFQSLCTVDSSLPEPKCYQFGINGDGDFEVVNTIQSDGLNVQTWLIARVQAGILESFVPLKVFGYKRIISPAGSGFILENTGQTAEYRKWSIGAVGTTFSMNMTTDSEGASYPFMSVSRTTSAIPAHGAVTFPQGIGATTMYVKADANTTALTLYNESTSGYGPKLDWFAATGGGVVFASIESIFNGTGSTTEFKGWSGTGQNIVLSIVNNTKEATFGGVVKAAGYKSSDGTAGATVTTCTGYKNGLCISGT